MQDRGKMRLVVIDFTAFNMAGERQFITDYTDNDGEGQHIARNKTKQEAIEFLNGICNTVIIHKTVEYTLEIIDKNETIVTEKYNIPVNLNFKDEKGEGEKH